MSPEQQASLLATWLDSQPGTEPPEGLDPDVVEGLYVLRPDRAPAPRVSVEDILAGLNPVSQSGAAAPPLPEAEVVSLGARRPRQARIWAAVGGLAAAALVLFVVVPSEQDAPRVGPAPEAVAPTMPQESATAPAPDAAPAKEQFDTAEFDKSKKNEQAKKPQPAAAARPAMDPGAAPGGSAAGSSSGYQRLELGKGDAASAGPSPLTEAEDVSVADERYAAPASKSAASVDDRTTDNVIAGVEAVARSEDSRRDRGPRTPSRGTTASSNVATPEPSVSAPSASGGRATGNLDGLRASATPADYNANWYLSADAATAQRVTERVEQADSQKNAGDRPGAMATLAAGISDTDPRAGQDFAGRAARMALDLGQASTALSYTQQGIRRSGTNTAFLARLCALQGEAYERLGQPEQAAASYGRAATLNMER